LSIFLPGERNQALNLENQKAKSSVTRLILGQYSWI